MPKSDVSLQVRGADSLKALGKELRRIGGPTSRGIRSAMRKEIVATAKPMQQAVQRAALAIPAEGTASTGLRLSLAKATRIRILASGRTALVRVWVDPSRMPADQQQLPPLMEGLRKWRHPVYGNTDKWVDQAAHPYFFPTVNPLADVARARVVAAVEKTATSLPKEV